jgi:hypothetical protein
MVATEEGVATPIAVTADNFARAESDLYFANVVKIGGFGKFTHIRQPAPSDQQNVIRMNRDTPAWTMPGRHSPTSRHRNSTRAS